jgi:hypothetical protein
VQEPEAKPGADLVLEGVSQAGLRAVMGGAVELHTELREGRVEAGDNQSRLAQRAWR